MSAPNSRRDRDRDRDHGGHSGSAAPSAQSPLRVHNLGSGSSGNALLIASGGAALLVDCGVERRRLVAGLAAAEISPASLAAVLVSHEHGDHVRSLPLLTGVGVTVVATEGTLAALGQRRDGVEPIAVGRDTPVAGFVVTALPVHHDARQPTGFTVAVADQRITVLTDLGQTDDSLLEAIVESDLIVLEANHDEALLREGPYPPQLKRRILSPRGHLSNANSALLLANALRRSRRHPTIWLAHLSQTNNRPALACETVRAALRAAGLDAPVASLHRSGTSQVWEANPARPSQLRLPW
ncbi:MAG: MBL fold metallo-hydrolase [Chloroflexia bacterium]|nr:MBL fold metallo-hydrolase [Chloroflexia bacterium]